MSSTIPSNVKRIDLRRPYTMTAQGLKRIVLGRTMPYNEAQAQTPPHAHAEKRKPLRRAANAGAATSCLLAAVYSERGALDEHARQAVAAAALLADAQTDVLLLVFGELNEDIAALGADCAIVLSDHGQHYAPDLTLEILSAVVAAHAPRHIFMPDKAISDGDLGRRLAAARSMTAAAHVVELNADGVAVHRHHGKRMARRNLPQMILLDIDAVDARLPFIGKGEQIAGPPVSRRGSLYSDLGVQTLAASQVALEEADFIVAAGNGMRDMASFDALAQVLDAAIGASRVAVDDGRFSRDKQIGATGKTVSASIYLAIGISGAVQHLQGIKDCRHVIACNLDASAPMIKRADLSIIGDASEVMQALLAAVKQARIAAASGAGATDAAVQPEHRRAA